MVTETAHLLARKVLLPQMHKPLIKLLYYRPLLLKCQPEQQTALANVVMGTIHFLNVLRFRVARLLELNTDIIVTVKQNNL